MANISKRNKRREKEIENAAKNRREIIAAQLSRRDMMKMGLLTSAGLLVPTRGLSARWADPRGVIPFDNPVSPPTRSFIEPLPIPPVQQPLAALTPAPTECPDTVAGEGRTRCHQAFAQFPPQKLYGVTQKAGLVSMSPDLPLQNIWAFAIGTPEMNNPITSPGPTYVNQYNQAALVRNFNRLPPANQNGGFGLPSVSTHLHNGHTPSESDGFACDFFERGQFYDQHYPNVLAGINSTHPGTGDINESLSTLWYHDHRVDFTSQNVYKGLAGFFILFNQFDTGNEATGFHLPTFPTFDIPLMFTDKVFDPNTGLLFFDLMNLDGILGDKFLVNGKIQPFFQVQPRRYRFRMLDAGPSRFYEYFLTDLNNLSASNRFWMIANDGNLLPTSVQISSFRLGVAERADVIIDFRPFAGRSIYLENRLEQTNGRGPTGKILPAGQGNLLMRFDVSSTPVADGSVDPATRPQFYALPSTTATPRVTRTFRFERSNGQWVINGQAINCDVVRFRVKRNTVEHWILQNNSGGWQHPIHIHFEEFQILNRNGIAPTAVERSRKDVVQLQFNEQIKLFFRFRDFAGRFPLHCHNTVHEDHAMILRWDIDDVGDTNPTP